MTQNHISYFQEDPMDFEKNLKYYNSNDTHFYIGFVTLIIGGVFFALAQLFHFWIFPYQPTISLIVAIVGALVAFVPRYMRSGGQDIDNAVTLMTKDYTTASAENIGITHMILKNPRPVQFGSFTYDREDLLVRRSKTDSKYRSNAYTVSAILFTKAGIFVSMKNFSLTGDRVEETVSDFVYTDLQKAEVTAWEQTMPDGHKKKLFAIAITAEDGTALRLPAEQSAALDRICDDINDQIKIAKSRV